MPLLLLPTATQGVYLRLLADPTLGQSGLCRPPLDLLVGREQGLDQLGASGYISVCHELGVVYVRQAAAVVSSSPSVLRAVAAEVRQLTCSAPVAADGGFHPSLICLLTQLHSDYSNLACACGQLADTLAEIAGMKPAENPPEAFDPPAHRALRTGEGEVLSSPTVAWGGTRGGEPSEARAHRRADDPADRNLKRFRSSVSTPLTGSTDVPPSQKEKTLSKREDLAATTKPSELPLDIEVTGTSAPAKKRRKKPEPPAEAVEVAEAMRRHVEELTQRGRDARVVARWAVDSERWYRLDRVPYAEQLATIDYVSRSDFWRRNILSIAKAREKYERLLIDRRDRPVADTRMVASVETDKAELARRQHAETVASTEHIRDEDVPF